MGRNHNNNNPNGEESEKDLMTQPILCIRLVGLFKNSSISQMRCANINNVRVTASSSRMTPATRLLKPVDRPILQQAYFTETTIF